MRCQRRSRQRSPTVPQVRRHERERALELRAQALRDETERLNAEAAEARKVEEARRADLIKQIRALELVRSRP